MEIKKIKQLIGILESSDLDELEVKEKDSSVKLVRRRQDVLSTTLPPVASAPSQEEPKESLIKEMTGHAIRSPMVGTFYSAPSPGSAPFVKVGSQIKEGDVIGIVEAMKTMNKIKSDRAGVIKEISVGNAQPVEYNQILCILE